MDPDQIKEARLSSIVAFGKGAGLLNGPTNLNERDRAMGQQAWVPGFLLEATWQKKHKKKQQKNSWY